MVNNMEWETIVESTHLKDKENGKMEKELNG